MSQRELVEDWVKTGCAAYALKYPDSKAVIYGSSAAYLLSLSNTIPRDLDLQVPPNTSTHTLRYVHSHSAFPGYALQLQDSTECAAGIRLPTRVNYMAATLLYITNREAQIKEYFASMTTEEIRQVVVLLSTVNGVDSSAAREYIDNLLAERAQQAI